MEFLRDLFRISYSGPNSSTKGQKILLFSRVGLRNNRVRPVLDLSLASGASGYILPGISILLEYTSLVIPLEFDEYTWNIMSEPGISGAT